MYRDLGLALTASILYTASLPPFDASIAAFAVSCPLTLLLLDPARPVRPGRAAVVGLFFGELTTLAVGGHWLFHGAHGFFGKTALLSALFTLVITVSHAGIFIAASIACTYPLRRLPPLARIAGFASVWVAWEYLRSSLLYGCPWDLLGHAFYRQPVLMQAGALGGVPLLSWVAVITGAAAATVWIERARPGVAVRAAAVACLAPLALVAYGWSASGWTEPAQPPRVAGKAPLRVALVQPNVGRHELWDPALGRGHLEHLLDLSRSGDLTGADLIVWPENAVPFILSADRAARRAIQRLADQSGAAILLGAPRSEDGGDGSVRFFNSIYLFTPSVGGEPAASPGGVTAATAPTTRASCCPT